MRRENNINAYKIFSVVENAHVAGTTAIPIVSTSSGSQEDRKIRIMLAFLQTENVLDGKFSKETITGTYANEAFGRRKIGQTLVISKTQES